MGLELSLLWENLSSLCPLMGLVDQSCPTLCDSMDCSLPGSSVRGIFQARILELGAIFYSRGSFQLRIEPTSVSSPASHLGSPRWLRLGNYSDVLGMDQLMLGKDST